MVKNIAKAVKSIFNVVGTTAEVVDELAHAAKNVAEVTKNASEAYKEEQQLFSDMRLALIKEYKEGGLKPEEFATKVADLKKQQEKMTEEIEL